MSELCPFVEANFQVNMRVDQAYSTIYQKIAQLVQSELIIVREIPTPIGMSPRKPTYVLLETRKGLLGLKRRQIEIKFKDKQTQTIVSIKWAYPTFENEIKSNDGLTRALWERNARKALQQATFLVEELKSQVGATDITEDSTMVTEIIKEKEVIVKIRCPYCRNVYEETLDRCPYCGGHR